MLRLILTFFFFLLLIIINCITFFAFCFDYFLSQKLKQQEQQNSKITTRINNTNESNKYSSTFESVDSEPPVKSDIEQSITLKPNKSMDSFGIYEPQKFEDFMNSSSSKQELSDKIANLSLHQSVTSSSSSSLTPSFDKNLEPSVANISKENVVDEEIKIDKSRSNVEKRSTEDVSSLISDIPPNINLKYNSGSDTHSRTIESISVDIKVGSKPSSELVIESNLKGVIQNYESDFEKQGSDSVTNKESTYDNSSIEEISLNGSEGNNFNFATIGMVSL